jgi:hypothetical protein
VQFISDNVCLSSSRGQRSTLCDQQHAAVERTILSIEQRACQVCSVLLQAHSSLIPHQMVSLLLLFKGVWELHKILARCSETCINVVVAATLATPLLVLSSMASAAQSVTLLA